MFLMAFSRDVDFHDNCPQSTYLDLLTGDVVWLYDNDHDAHMEAGLAPEENHADRERVASDPDRYLAIPGLDHGDHHDILNRFLRSERTRDESLRQRAGQVYSGSIGRWKRDVGNDEAVHAFYAFREEEIDKLAEEFLTGSRKRYRPTLEINPVPQHPRHR